MVECCCGYDSKCVPRMAFEIQDPDDDGGKYKASMVQLPLLHAPSSSS